MRTLASSSELVPDRQNKCSNTDGYGAGVGEDAKVKHHTGTLTSSWAFVPFAQESCLHQSSASTAPDLTKLPASTATVEPEITVHSLPQWLRGRKDLAKWGQFAQITYDVYCYRRDASGNVPTRFDFAKYFEITYDVYGYKRDANGNVPTRFDFDGDSRTLQELTNYGLCFHYEVSPGGPDHVKCEYDFSGDFEVVSSIYTKAMDSHHETAWAGFIAVETAEAAARDGRSGRDVVISWRGTQTNQEWVADGRFIQAPWFSPEESEIKPLRELDQTDAEAAPRIQSAIADIEADDTTGPPMLVHRGFNYMYNRRCDQHGHTERDDDGETPRNHILATLGALRDEPQVEVGRIIATGHSLGAALATLNAYDVVQMEWTDGKKAPAFAVTWASPPVGNDVFCADMDAKFKDAVTWASLPVGNDVFCADMGAKMPGHVSVTNDGDLVPSTFMRGYNSDAHMPGHVRVTNDGDLVPSTFVRGYSHGGQQLMLSSQGLEDKKLIEKLDGWNPFDIGQLHNLELHLHLVDDTRPLEVMNKSDDLLSQAYRAKHKVAPKPAYRAKHTVVPNWMSVQEPGPHHWPRYVNRYERMDLYL
ncbi:Alpha/Beta hydrolase protein [Tribonema minus]|uniref:Alpha/Beta hydrolase protein n=1 Tax=Tribonema minus TaxID=303371 RepID=A0A836CDJ3_9STRA|nr:Alpha/Beta hydrolase protein [Tribonema minus]